MRILTFMLMLLLLLVMLVAGTAATAQTGPLVETRYCGAPKRDASGDIIRRADVIAAYRKLHPCPSTGKLGKGACPDWALNHNVSLACGGCDSVSNLSFMRNDVKKIVDSYELKINASTPPQPDTARCVNKVLP